MVSVGGRLFGEKSRMPWKTTNMKDVRKEFALKALAQVEVWFSYLLLGTIDLQTNRFGSAPSRSAKAVGLAA